MMDDALGDWIPPSGQPALTPPVLTRPAQKAPAGTKTKRKSSPEVDLFPSPETRLDQVARHSIQSWADGIGSTPKRSKVQESTPEKTPGPLPVIRKISNIQPGKRPLPKCSPPKVKLQKNGIALPVKEWFDPWNACTTGHQTAQNKMSGSIEWRQNRERKWKQQFGDTSGGGGKRLYDTVGAGSKDFGKDGRKADGGWEKGAPGLRGAGQKSIMDCFEGSGTNVEQSTQNNKRPSQTVSTIMPLPNAPVPLLASSALPTGTEEKTMATNIFRNIVIYVNGSTYPIISDHTLRQLIIQHGGQLSIALLRKSITHVILTHKDQLNQEKFSEGTQIDSTDGTISISRDYQAAGGGLAAGKIRKELQRNKPSTLKYVTAHWVIESVKAGKRLPESWFADWRFVEKGQSDMRRFYGLSKNNDGEEDVTKNA